jgi:hypothetical protein
MGGDRVTRLSGVLSKFLSEGVRSMKILSGPFLGNMAFELNDVRLFNLVRRWYDDLVLKLDSVGMYAVFNNAFPDPQSLFHYCKTVI